MEIYKGNEIHALNIWNRFALELDRELDMFQSTLIKKVNTKKV